MNSNQKASLILRIALAFSFIYAAISSFMNPTNWIGFLPSFIPNPELMLTIFSVFEIVLGLWLLSNKKLYLASIVSAITLAAITIPNLGAMDIVFRDISLFLAAVALVFLAKE